MREIRDGEIGRERQKRERETTERGETEGERSRERHKEKEIVENARESELRSFLQK